ncbi:MAG: type IV pilus assembly protein PilM [Desulfobacteraceae bacterium]|nr:type IV pilus assembly protein PilM [Desulfobacteraceae bacterium]
MNSIGLDIGNHSIKVVELRHTPEAVFMTNFAVKELPLDARGDKRSAGVIAEMIKELFQEENIRPKKVTIGVSGSQVAIRHISLPYMPKKEIKEAVRWEARKLISFPLEKAIVEFQLLGEVIEEGVKKLDLMVAVADGDLIESQLALIKGAGLEPAGITTIPHALWHCMQTIPETGEEVTALIDIGATKTSISIVKNNRLQFTREISTAGNAFTEAIREAATLEDAALDFAGAEEVKKECGIPKEEDVDGTKGHVSMQKISFAMRPLLERLSTEIKRSFEFYKNQIKEEVGLRRIFICGGGAGLKGLREYIEDQLSTEVDLLAPFKDMEPILSIATGLALGRARELNLLPEKYRLTPVVLLKRYSSVALACLIIFVLLGIWLRVDVTCNKYGKQLSIKETRLAGLQPADRKLGQLKENKKRLDQDKALLPRATLEQPQWKKILKEISYIVPKKTVLTHLVFRTKDTGKEMRLKGIAFGGDAKIVESILEIMQGLENSPLFLDVRLSSSEESNEYNMPGANFELVCKVIFLD